MEVVAVETPPAVCAALRTAGGRTLSPAAASALATTTTTTACAILHQDQPGPIILNKGADRARNARGCERRHRGRRRAARQRQGRREQQCESRAHVSAPDIWLGEP